MSFKQEIIFTDITLFKDSICEISQIYNTKSQQRNFIPKFKNELLKSIISGNWEYFSLYKTLTGIHATTGIAEMDTSKLNSGKVILLFTKDKMYIGYGIDFKSRPNDIEGMNSLEERFSKIFQMKTVSPGHPVAFMNYEFDTDSKEYKNVVRIFEFYMTSLITEIISMSNENFTNQMFGSRINCLEIMSYITLKSLNQKIELLEDSLQKYKNKEDQSNADKIKEKQNKLKNCYKIHDYIARIILQDYTLDAFKWYTFMNTKSAAELITGSYRSIFAFDKCGLIMKHKSPVGTDITLKNKDVITFSIRNKPKNYDYAEKSDVSRTVPVVFDFD